MKVKILYETPTMPYRMVVETIEGEKKMFYVLPFRHLTEKDLSPAPGYQAKGNGAKEAAAYFYQMYGLEKTV